MPEVGISIIVPAYNEEGVISDCLNSLVNLNYPKNEYEIIIVNDGSTDKTANVLCQMQNYEVYICFKS